jgi:hypothetical protein
MAPHSVDDLAPFFERHLCLRIAYNCDRQGPYDSEPGCVVAATLTFWTDLRWIFATPGATFNSGMRGELLGTERFATCWKHVELSDVGRRGGQARP